LANEFLKKTMSGNKMYILPFDRINKKIS